MKLVRIAALGIVGVVMAGCSSSTTGSPVSTTKQPSSTSSEATPPSRTNTAVPNVQSMLLNVSDVPKGWFVDNTPQTASVNCYTNPLKKVPSTAYAHTKFAQGGSLPSLVEELGLYASGPTAFATIAGSLDGCKTFTQTGQGETINGVMGPMSSPSYGDQSAAYSATLSIKGSNINQGFVIARKGNFVTLVALADFGSLDATALQQFVNQAVAKVAG